jgi:hypothetical protein
MLGDMLTLSEARGFIAALVGIIIDSLLFGFLLEPLKERIG